jgi:GTPase
MITVFNKADLVEEPRPQRAGNDLIITALEDKSIDELVHVIREISYVDYVTKTFLIPFDHGDIVNYLNSNTNVLKTEYLPTGTKITAELSSKISGRFKAYLVN